MKSKGALIAMLMAVNMLGCERKPRVIPPEGEYVYVRLDPNSAQICMMALTPIINQMHEDSRQLMVQNAWLKQSLDKCLEKLEAERGLEPIRRKHGNFLKGDPNFPMPPEPWYEPYETPDVVPLVKERSENIRLLMVLLGINLVSVRQNIATTNDWIENFEERMQRLEKCLDESGDANTTPLKQ